MGVFVFGEVVFPTNKARNDADAAVSARAAAWGASARAAPSWASAPVGTARLTTTGPTLRLSFWHPSQAEALDLIGGLGDRLAAIDGWWAMVPDKGVT